MSVRPTVLFSTVISVAAIAGLVTAFCTVESDASANGCDVHLVGSAYVESSVVPN